MTYPSELLLRAEWGGRIDSFEDQVAMMWECWRRFAAHGRFMGQTWYSLNVKPGQLVRMDTIEALQADMTQAQEQGYGSQYGYTQGTTNRSADALPHLSMSSGLSSPRGWSALVANKIVADMEVGDNIREADPLPVEWLLSIGASLVKDFVDVWRPDAVSFDSVELLRIPSRIAPKMAYPTIGYVSWLSELVVDSVGLPPAPIRESYEGGTLLGIVPDSSDPVGDAIRLAEIVYASNVLRIIPFVQGQPNPDENANGVLKKESQ